MIGETSELHYAVLIFALFVLPRILVRLNLPTAISALGLGALIGISTGWFVGDMSLKLLATLGIVSLFLFAGLDVDFEEIKSNGRVIVVHVVTGVALLITLAFGLRSFFEIDARPAWLLALALITPSCGFILDSLDSMNLSDQEKFWIKSKGIATELVSLAAMFLLMQEVTFKGLGVSLLSMAAMIALLPVVFRLFASRIAPLAPNSEFAFLIIIALICSMITRKLDAYYLVGAFIVGMTAHRFQKLLPSITSNKMLHAIQLFASFFTPFYFFHAGLGISRDDLSLRAFLVGIGLFVVVAPLRTLVTMAQRRLSLGEAPSKSFPIATSLLPTLVFGLVLAGILKNRFDVPRYLFGGVIIYTILITILPGLILKASPKSGRHLESSAGPELPLM